MLLHGGGGGLTGTVPSRATFVGSWRLGRATNSLHLIHEMTWDISLSDA